jgi:hypothetical protein
LDQTLKFKYPPPQDTGEIPFTSVIIEEVDKGGIVSESYAH